MSRIIAENMPEFPRVQSLARRAKAISPDTPFPTVCELLRVSPYSLLAVVDTPGESSALLTGPLLGIVSTKTITDRFLLASPLEGDQLRKYGTARDVCDTLSAADCATPSDTATEVVALFDRIGRDATPVLESRASGYYIGMVGRADLLRDLHRPFVPPQIGGMATPMGVYLTTGQVSGGVGTLALAATGFLTYVLHMTGMAALATIKYSLHRYAPPAARFAENLPIALFTLAEVALFLTLLRQTPLAGYHAAEHQVVHTIERGEPLLPDIVRAMPRVHPRCSTNLVAGLLLFYIIGTALMSSMGADVSYLIGSIAAFFWWRPVGSFLQQYATTRPANDREIASGIRAAQDLFQALDTPLATSVPKPASPIMIRFQHIWRMGFLQIFLGSGAGFALLRLLGLVYAPLGKFLQEISL